MISCSHILFLFKISPKMKKIMRQQNIGFISPFQTRIDILLRSTSAKPYFVHLGQKNHFVWNGPKGSRWTQTGSQMIKKTYVYHFGPFWTLLDPFGALTSLPCLAIFGPKWTIFGPSPVMNGRPQSEKRFIITSPMCGLLVEPQLAPFGT